MSHPIACIYCGLGPGTPGVCQCEGSREFKAMDPITEDGWTEWVYPAAGYRMKCCDCGLVHELEFRVFAETKQHGEEYEVVEMPWPLRAMFRARRG